MPPAPAKRLKTGRQSRAAVTSEVKVADDLVEVKEEVTTDEDILGSGDDEDDVDDEDLDPVSNRNGDDPPLVLNKVWVDSLTQRNGVAHGFLPPLEWHENRTRVLSRARTARRTVWARRTRKKSPRRSFPSRP
jgi:hypothetical protein|tara:strand:+ start:1109 stop:1507 length:399 start_codon:yes stop_codon:yes gene_type:complete